MNEKKSGPLLPLITGVLAVGLNIIINFVLIQYIPTQDYYTIYILTILALLPAISEGCKFPLYHIYALTLKNRISCYVTIIGGVLNVGSYVCTS